MLGSPFEAEDAVQETMVRAWRGLSGFDGRSSLQTWLYRIATNVCLDALKDRTRRSLPMREGPAWSAATSAHELQRRPARHWLEPIPEHLAVPEHADPATRLVLRQSIRLAFVAALQCLPPKQRAALLLTEVLGWSVHQTAASLNTSVAAINSALQRARASLQERGTSHDTEASKLSPTQAELVERFTHAFEAYDVETLSRLLTADAVLSMPPYSLWLQGAANIETWLSGTGAGCKGSKLLPIRASGVPAFAQYRQGGAQAWAILTLELRADAIACLTYFLGTQALFPLFQLPLQL